MWAKLSKVLLKYRILIAILIVVSSAFMIYKASEIKTSYSMVNMLPKNAKENIDHKHFLTVFKSDANIILLGVRDSNLYRLNAFNAWGRLSQQFDMLKVGSEKMVGVKNVFSIVQAFALERDDSLNQFTINKIFKQLPKSQSELDSIIQSIRQYPFYKNYLYKNQDPFTVMLLYVNEEVLESKLRKPFYESIVKNITAFEKATGISVKTSGLPYIRITSTSLLSKEMIVFVILSISIICGLLLLFFKSFKTMFFSLLVVGLGVLWSLGLLSLLDYEITVVSAIVAPLILVIGVPNCVFMINKYYAEFAYYKDKKNALLAVIQKMGQSIFLTNLTTAIGFFTFVFTKNKELREFGITASLSVMALFLLSITIIPIIYSFLSPPKARHTKHLSAKWLVLLLDRAERIILYKRKQVYLFFATLSLLSIGGILMLETTGRVSEDLPSNGKIVEDLSFFDNHLSGVLPFEIMINTKEKNGLLSNNAKALYVIKKFQRKLKKIEGLSNPLSIIDALKFTYQAYKGGEKKYFILPAPTELKKLKPYLPKQNSKSINKELNNFVDSNLSIARISYRIKDIDINQMDSLIAKVNIIKDAVFKDIDYEVSITGESLVFLSGTKFMVNNLLTSIILAIILISLFMATLFSSWEMVIISIIPNLIPLLMIAGAMGYLGIAIKPSTILIFSIAFGIAVDDSIHFLSKFKQEYKHRPNDMFKSAIYALKETGYSMVYTSIILFCGFSIFLSSDFGGTMALGLLLPLTIFFAILSDLILLPCLLLSFDKLVILKAIKKEPLIEVMNEEVDIDLDNINIKK